MGTVQVKLVWMGREGRWWALSKEVEQSKQINEEKPQHQSEDCRRPALPTKALSQTFQCSGSELAQSGRDQPVPQVAQLQWK